MIGKHVTEGSPTIVSARPDLLLRRDHDQQDDRADGLACGLAAGRSPPVA